MPIIALFVVSVITLLIGGSFFVRALFKKEPKERIRLSLYGFAFMFLGYLGNYFLESGL
jgi:predicted permease